MRDEMAKVYDGLKDLKGSASHLEKVSQQIARVEAAL